MQECPRLYSTQTRIKTTETRHTSTESETIFQANKD